MSTARWDRAWRAYERARDVDRAPSDESRRAACKLPIAAYMYAAYVDKAARDDTREAACREPAIAYLYALHVDRGPTPATREALSCDARLAAAYAAAFREPARPACRRCGCTDDRACPGGCWWVEADLCSACASAVLALPDPRRGKTWLDVTKTPFGSRVARGYRPAEEE